MEWSALVQGFLHLEWKQVVMLAVGGGLVYLGIARRFEPLLLVPIGVGAFLANLPITGLNDVGGLFWILEEYGLKTELFPLLIFVGLGALTDFGPMLSQPITILLGAAAQLGIFTALMLAVVLGFSLKEAAAIGIIGSADGPTTIYVSTLLAPRDLWAPIAVAAYSYMALVPVIQPPIMRLLTTRAERRIRMPYVTHGVSRKVKILFPIVTTLFVGMVAPKAVPLVGTIMFGNLLRECGVVERLSHTAQNELINIVTLFLGLTVGSTMTAASFLNLETIKVLFLGLFAFALSTVGGVLLGKIMCVLSGRKINPLIGAAGVSAVPMAARVAQKVASDEDFTNFIMMQAMGPNVAGVIGSAIAGGVLLGQLL